MSSTPLAQLLADDIARGGPIPFADFMAQALYHPEHGYYSSGRARIGRAGDFFTNVSVGALFGRLLARQFAEMWERLGRPRPFTIVEQGAHRGEFAHDVLSALDDFAPDCARAAEYRIVEPAPVLRATQQERLAAFSARARWHRTLGDLDPVTGVHFSNELLDAFPVHVVKWDGAQWRERLVAATDDGFAFTDGPLSRPELRTRLDVLPPVPPGYVTEIHLATRDWIDALADRLPRGYVLAIDYGFTREEYYRADRTAGTLSAYAAHRREPNPLARPGEIDLTAHVEFTSLIERAATRGFDPTGFTDQHHFMVGLGRLHFPDTDTAPNAARQRELRAFQTLMHPTLMGRAFKVLCLARGVAPEETLAGFQFARG